MKKHSFIKLFFIILIVLAGVQTAYPCRCVPASQKTFYKRADAIITAKVISISTGDEQSQTVKLEVSKAWKKSVAKQLEVIIENSSCAYSVQNGEEHLLYLKTVSDGKFSTMQCQGNLPLSDSLKSQNWLKRYGKKMSVENSSTSLYFTSQDDWRIEKLFNTNIFADLIL